VDLARPVTPEVAGSSPVAPVSKSPAKRPFVRSLLALTVLIVAGPRLPMIAAEASIQRTDRAPTNRLGEQRLRHRRRDTWSHAGDAIGRRR
jgi:hypothetical protein